MWNIDLELMMNIWVKTPWWTVVRSDGIVETTTMEQNEFAKAMESHLISLFKANLMSTPTFQSTEREQSKGVHIITFNNKKNLCKKFE